MADMFVPTRAEIERMVASKLHEEIVLQFCGGYDSLRELKKHVGRRIGNVALCKGNDSVRIYVWDGEHFTLIGCWKTLKLVLIGKWYRMIESGEKPEEYRELKAYYHAKFRASRAVYNKVTFYLGYGKDRPQMTFGIKEIAEGTGREEWGATPGKMYYVIKLGERII